MIDHNAGITKLGTLIFSIILYKWLADIFLSIPLANMMNLHQITYCKQPSHLTMNYLKTEG